MNLFNRKTQKRRIKADPIPSNHLAALISSGQIERTKEITLHGDIVL